ncbi:hypothetical protein EKE94_08375 [Mesobaculum littorinae]|uniref:Uncharacterized protein n=1 Tax=Mesobaculum littorinae TaxID=2486419 RepID=A0A438AJT1_9RHOB|nr:hypothetical protein [Mesobaculum littorinae]RVV98896.1 hypothetical protein EKE94_08375 [Mesobaculum littorinae]
MTAILRLSGPITLWLAGFCAVYGLHGLLCSSRWGALVAPGTGRALLIVAALAAVAAQGALLAALRRPHRGGDDPVIRKATLILAATALVASIWTLLPVAVTSHCL